MERPETVALSLLAAVEGAHFFSARLPSKMTIVKFVDDPVAVAAIKAGILEASILAMGLCAVVAWIAKSSLPLLIGSISTGIMAWLSYRDLQSRREV